MAKDTERFTVYLSRDWIRAVRMEAIRRGVTASRLVADALMKDRKLADQLPTINGKEKK